MRSHRSFDGPGLAPERPGHAEMSRAQWSGQGHLKFRPHAISLRVATAIGLVLVLAVAAPIQAEQVSFPVDIHTPDLIQGLADLVGVAYSPTRIADDYADQQEPRKWVAFISGSAIVLGAKVSIDLADYLGLTCEGQQGWVTVWAEVSGGLEMPPGLGVPIGLGAYRSPFNRALPDSAGPLFDCHASVDLPCISVTAFGIDSSLGTKLFEPSWALQTSFGLDASCAFHGISFEIQKSELNKLIYKWMVPGMAPVTVADFIVQNIMHPDSVDWSSLPSLSNYRPPTNEDCPSDRMLRAISHPPMVVGQSRVVSIDIFVYEPDWYTVAPIGFDGLLWGAECPWPWEPWYDPNKVYISAPGSHTFDFAMTPNSASARIGWVVKRGYIITPIVEFTDSTLYAYPAGTDFTSPFVTNHSAQGATSSSINVWFSEALDVRTLTNQTVKVTGSVSGTKSCDLIFLDSEGHKLVIDPADHFALGERVTVTLSEEDIRDLAGNNLVYDGPYANYAGENEGAIAGRVTDGRTGLGISGARVVALQNGGIAQATDANASGYYTITGIAPATFQVYAQAAGYVASPPRDVVVADLQTSTLDIALQGSDVTPPTALEHITGSIGRDASLWISFSEDMSYTSLASGVVTVAGSDSGAHACSLTFDHIAYRLVIDPALDFSFGETVTVTVGAGAKDLAGNPMASPCTFALKVVSQAGGISGRVTSSSGGAGVANCLVSAANSGQVAGQARTDGSGNYSISGLAAATYTVSVAPSDGYWGSYTQYATVTPGGTATASFTVDPRNTNAPTVSISSPGASTTAQSVVFAGTATASGSKTIAKLEWNYTPLWWRPISAPDRVTEPWSFSINLMPGLNILYVKATDNQGNYTIATRSVTYKPSGVDVWLTNYADGQVVSTGRIMLEGGSAGVAKVQWLDNCVPPGVWRDAWDKPGGQPYPLDWTGGDVCLSCGLNDIRFRGFHSDGTPATPERSLGVYRDCEPPSVAVTSPVSTPKRVPARTFRVEGTARDNIALRDVQLRVQDVFLPAMGLENWSADLQFPATYNWVEVFAQATDFLGQTTNSATIQFIYDTTSPNVVVTSPIDNQLVPAGSVSISGTATDPDGDDTVTRVQLSVNGGSLSDVPITQSVSWQASAPITPGRNSIQVQATDLAGNIGTRTLVLRGDPSPPLVAFTSPPNDQVLTASPVDVRGIASDDTGLASVTISVNGQNWLPVDGTLQDWSKTVSLIAGKNTLKAKATDLAGQFSYDVIQLWLDLQAPTLTVDWPTAGALVSSPLAIHGTAADVDTGVARVEASVNGGPFFLMGGKTSWSGGVTLQPGDNTIAVRATDLANRQSSVVSVSVVMGLSPPSEATANPPTVPLGAGTTLSASVAAGQTVDWYIGACGGTPVTSGTSVVVYPTGTQSYFARTRDLSTGEVSTACAGPVVVEVVLSVSGHVRRYDGTPLAGVQLEDLPGTPTTDANGFYSAVVPCGWSEVVKPRKPGWWFAPAARSYSNLSSVQSDQDYAASTFVPAAAGLPDLEYCSIACGDYDNDGRLDLAVTGAVANSEKISRIYHNDGGSFADAGTTLAGLYLSSVAWGDLDNDGDLDLALAGHNGSQGASLVYKNTGGAFTARALSAAAYRSGVAWGDYDNDGDLDLAIAGGGISKIYRNDNGSFVDTQAALPGLTDCALAWGDYDNDGDLDLVLAGYDGSKCVSRLYRNSSGAFAESGIALPGVEYCSVAWGDYDSDGDLDLAIAGYTGSERITKIYRNDGGTALSGIDAALPGVQACSVAWGDYDNDGDLDLALAGHGASGRMSKIYCYDRIADTDTFADSSIELAKVGGEWVSCSLAWGDYDSDGNLDLALAGATDSGRITEIYRNCSAVPNTPPTPPSGLAACYTADGLTMRWNAATDLQTPTPGLSYNVRVGSTPGGSDVFSGMADASSGLRRLPATGNAQKKLTWTLKNIPLRPAYYLSVQAIDTAFAGSQWAPECTARFTEPVAIGDAKLLPDGCGVACNDMVVSAVFAGCFYVESEDRSSGIRVLATGQVPAVGVRVAVSGIMATNADGERYIEATSVVPSGVGSTKPLVLRTASVGGGDWHITGTGGQRGVKNGRGLNSIGLLVQTAGRITSVDPGGQYFTISDGSAWKVAEPPQDPDGNPGVRIWAPGMVPAGLAVGDFVTVTGVVSCYKSGADLHPRVLVRTASDIVRVL